MQLGRQLTNNLKDEILNFVAVVAPNWKGIDIKTSHEYLGFVVGPQGGNIASWKKAITNYNSAVKSIASARLPPSAGTAFYLTHALTRLTYIPQLCTPLKSSPNTRKRL